MPADELLCACDVPHCSVPNCTGKVCLVSKRREDGRIVQHRGCFSSNLMENCRPHVMEQYGTRCCDSNMCNAELEIYLPGTGTPRLPQPRLRAVPLPFSRSHGERGRVFRGCGDVFGSLNNPSPLPALPGSPFRMQDGASEVPPVPLLALCPHPWG